MSNETKQKQRFEIHPPGWELESWQRVHAQLLKNVADAQAKLLAAQNETNDRLERMDRDLRVLIAQTQEAVRNSHGSLDGRLNGMGGLLLELLAKPRRRVLDPAIARAKQRKRHA